MIDWTATGHMLVGIGTLAGAIAIIVAAILGRDAVTRIRRQKQVERQIEHAEKTLTAAYQLGEAIGVIRSPLSTAQELASAQEELEATDWFSILPSDEQQRVVQANVFYQRIRSFDEIYNAAVSVLPFVKAYFGEEAETAFKKLIHARHTVRVYADAYARDRGNDPKYSQKVESFVWAGAADEGGDPVASEVTNAIGILERHLLPVVRESSASEKVNNVNA